MVYPLDSAESITESRFQYRVLLLRIKGVAGRSHHEHHAESCLMKLVIQVEIFMYKVQMVYALIDESSKIAVENLRLCLER